MENALPMASVQPCSGFYSDLSFADSPSSTLLFNADIPQGCLLTPFSLQAFSSPTLSMPTMLSILLPVQTYPLSSRSICRTAYLKPRHLKDYCSNLNPPN